MQPKNIFILLLILASSTWSYSQSFLAHEIGVTAGPVNFRTDYGEKGDFDSNVKNTGYGIGLVHYLNFSSGNYRDKYFSEHVRVRSELSYQAGDFQHFGQWIEGGNNTIGKQQLRAMRGSTKLVNLGAQAEFHIIKIHSFENFIGSFDPYVSLGALYTFYDVTSTSTMGQLGDPLVTFPKYLTPSDGKPFGFTSESNSTYSIVAGVGTRYKLTTMSDLLLDLRFQYFGTDWVEGLNPNKELYKENKNNDWNVWLNFGYIYYFEF
jgi:hypothetical protein